MAAKDLVTLARAEQSMQNYTPGSNDAVVSTLITAASEAIEKYCCRHFYSRAFDELYNGTGDRRLVLREYPIQAVQSVRYRPVTVLKIQNTDQQTNQRATVAVTSTGLTLTRVASGVTTIDTSSTFAGFPTLQGLVNNVNGLGNGWTAQIVGVNPGDYGSWPSADLYVPPSYGDGVQSQGAITARGVYAELKMHTYELAGYQWDPRGWLLRAIPYTDPELLHPEDLIWPVGINNFRVQYTTGYTTIPEAVQEACAEWVNELYQLASRDPAAKDVRLQGSGATFRSHAVALLAALRPPDNVARLLAPYRRYTMATNQG
ncbi:MAG TPA: hypothetical protein VKE94_21655 [Gemmataceae bacterium]|nr:hypothetical protein [Gemmataceae bacterium]